MGWGSCFGFLMQAMLCFLSLKKKTLYREHWVEMTLRFAPSGKKETCIGGLDINVGALGSPSIWNYLE